MHHDSARSNSDNYCHTVCAKGNVLYIVAGADGDSSRISDSIAVPSMLWKVAVVVAENPNGLPVINSQSRVIAVRMLNNDKRIQHADWRVFRTSVAQLENELLLDDKPYRFFDKLPKDLAAAFRKRIDSEEEDEHN